MPMIDVYAPEGTFPEPHTLARDLAAAVIRWEQVPDLPLFTKNTAAFIHDMDAAAISNVAGDSSYVRVQVLTPVGVLDRDKQLGVVAELTDIIAAAAGDPGLRERVWVLLTESPEGGWGIAGSRQHERRHRRGRPCRPRRSVSAVQQLAATYSERSL